MPIQWEPHMSVGVAQFDQDHKDIIDCLNTIGAARMRSERKRESSLF